MMDFCTGCFDDISSNGDVAANTFKINLNINNIVDNFEYYQIGVVCLLRNILNLGELLM